MRILLVKPQAHLNTILGLERFQRLEPLELGYLAAAVGPEHNIRVLDLRLYRNPTACLTRSLRRFAPDLVGFTGYSHEATTIKSLAQIVRQYQPKAKIVVGGHHATVAPADCNVPQIDYIVRGEGCGPFRRLVAALAEGETAGGIANVLQTGAEFDEAGAQGWPEYPDPATLPLPRRDLWRARDYYCVWACEEAKNWQQLYPRVAMMRTSYGCRMKCSFCVVPHLCGGKHRPRPIEAVVAELESLEADHVYFADDENFIDEDYANALAEAIERKGIRKRYFAWTRATTVVRSPDLIKTWRRIGLDAAFLGFEFPTDEQLKAAHKGGTVATNQKAHTMLREMGVACHAAFMMRPEDGEAEFSRLQQFVSEMPPVQCSFTVCTPSPGTSDHEQARPEMWVKNPYDLHDCMHPLLPTKLSLREFGGRFADLLETASRKNPVRVEKHLAMPWELVRVIRAERRYMRAFRLLYQDYPRELWDWKGKPASLHSQVAVEV
jgi:hopanoid C-3 methylase